MIVSRSDKLSEFNSHTTAVGTVQTSRQPYAIIQ